VLHQHTTFQAIGLYAVELLMIHEIPLPLFCSSMFLYGFIAYLYCVFFFTYVLPHIYGVIKNDY